jgi:gliding motility-associated-like protein
MKRYYYINSLILLLGLIILNSQTSAQTTTAFRKNYDVAIFDLPGNIVEGLTPETYVMAGTNLTFLPIYGTVTELNDTGAINWSFRYSDASIGFQLNDIKKDVGSNQYITCGGSETNAAVFMVLDAAGNVVISKRFSINEADGAWFNRVIKASDGGYVAVGYVTGHDPDGAGPETYFAPINYIDANGDPQTEVIGSPLIVKLDASGNHVWHQVFRYYTASTTTPAERIYNDASFVDVVEVSDGYVAVGNYDVNQHLSATDSDGDDATPTDAIILKTSTAGAITYHKQIDTPDTDPSQNSKHLATVNTTAAGDIIMGGMDNTKELIQKYVGPGGFSNIFSRRFTYPGFLSVTDVSQIYEVNGGTDLATMSMYIQPTGFVFSNAIHRFNPTATSTVFAKRYDFNLISILPRGNKTSDNGYISMSMTAGGANYDYHVIKTDPNGDTPANGCPPVAFTPNADTGPTTSGDPSFTPWVGTPGSNSLTILRQSIAPTPNYVCTKIICSPPQNPTASAAPTTICAGSSTTINGSGSGIGATYNVYTAATGGTNLGSTPLIVSPGTTTTYYIEGVLSSCPSATRDPITITVVNITTSNAGSNQSVCATTATLAGNTVTNGSGVWTLISGAGTITTPGSPNSGVTGLGIGPNVFEWTITNAPCASSTSQVTITGVAAPTTSNAGVNQTLCATSATLAGNALIIGTGTWTLISGAGTITTPTSPNSGVTGLGTGPNVFEWTITNSPCPPSTSQVTITNTGGPTTSNAGVNQSVCATTATLAGNTPTTGNGTWTLISGSGTITTPSSPTSGVTGLSTGPNVFEWTISNSPCTPSTSQVTITGVAAPTTSNAGTNQTICATSTNLAGNTPTIGTGTWTLISGSGTVTTPTSPNSGVTGLGTGPNVFEWTITNSPCPPSTSQVTITNTGGPTTSNAGVNQTLCSTSATLAGNTPTTGTGTWTLISGAGTITTPTSPNSGVTGLGIGPNVFEWTIGNSPCTPSTSQVTITGVAAPTTSNAGTNQTICATSTNLAGNTPTIGTGTWTLISGSGTITTPGSPNSGVTGLGIGPNVFEWTITNTPCTSSSTQVTITYSLGPTVIANSTDTIICQGDTITLTGTGAVSYTWTGGANDGVPFSPGTTTTYIVTGTDANSCSNTDTISVTVNPLPTINVNGINSICNGDSTLLTATGGTSYTWSTSDVTPTVNVTPATTTTYTVTGTDANGCQNIGQITVTVLAPPIAAISGTSTVCDGDVVNLTASGGGTYVWSTGDTTTIINVNPTGTTTYTLIATIGSCIDTTTFTINVTPLPTIILTPSPDTTISLGESADLIASGGTSYTWTPSTDLSCSTCANPVATPDVTTTYCVEATNNGCVDTACVTVIVDINCGEVFVPNAFSPNGDESNDCLKVYNNCIETMVFRVYARWGEIVFEATDVDQCWDGSFKGKDLNNAVFVYTLEATLITGEKISLKGNVSLIR